MHTLFAILQFDDGRLEIAKHSNCFAPSCGNLCMD
jgi:hypothetical protein